MADESVTFDIKVVGLKDLKEAANTFERTGKVSRQLAAQFKPVGAATERVVNETRKLESIHRKLSKAIEDGIISRKQANNAMDEAIRRSKEAILTDRNLIEIEKKKAKAAEEARKNEERLVKLYAPARAAAREYARTTLEIRNAHRSGAINAEEMAEALATVKREFDEFTKGVATGGNQFAKFNVEAYKAAQRLKRGFNQGLQQAGYQVGDFIVQVQSGQSALVALGQQGSQLAGIFGPYGAIVGALLAAGTAAGTMYLQWKEAAEGARDAVLSLAEAQKLLKESVAGYETEIAKLEFGVDSEAEAKVLREILRLKKEDLRIRTEMNETDSLSTRLRLSTELKEGRVKLQSLEREAAKHREIRESYENLVRIKGLEESFDEDRMKSLEEYGLAYEEGARRRSTIAAMQGDIEAKAAAESQESRNAAIQLYYDNLEKAEAERARVETERAKVRERMAGEEAARLEYRAQAQAALLEENARYEEEQEKARQKAKEAQDKLNSTSRLALSIQLLKNEALAAEVAAREAAARKDDNAAALQQAANDAAIKAAGEIAYLKERAKGVSVEIAQAARIAAEEEERGRIALAGAAAEGRELDAALRAAASAMASLTGFTSSLEKRLEVARAKVEAIKSGANEAAAAAEAGFKFEAAEKYQEALGAARGPEEIAAANQEYQRQLELIGQIRTEEQAAADAAEARRGKGGGGGASKERLKEAMKEFEELRSYLQQVEELNRYYGMSELQILNDKYAERQRVLQESLQKEYLTEAQYKEMLLVLEQDYQNKKKGLAVQTTQAYTSAIGGLLSSFASMQDGQSKKSFEKQKKLRKAAAVVEGIGATIAAYRDGMEKGGPILATVQAAAAVAATAAQIKAIDSATFSGGGRASSVSAPAASTATPAQRVLIQGIKPNDLITGAQLSEIFDKLYEENENRGLVFQIAS